MNRVADNGITGKRKNIGFWIGLFALLATAAAIALAFGWSIWTALLLAFLLACPIVIVWTYALSQRPVPVPLGPAPVTRGDVWLFDRIAPWYDNTWCPACGFGRAFRNRVATLCAFAKGEQVLDVGCGTGWLTRIAADAVGPSGTAWGIDPAPDMIRLARQTAGCRHCGARFKFAAAEDLPFEDDSFDVVILSLVLHHLPPDARAAGLREVRRVLRDTGRLIVVDINAGSHWFPRALLALIGLLPNVRSLARDGVERTLREAGFSPIDRIGAWGAWFAIWRAAKPPSREVVTRVGARPNAFV